VVMSVRRATVMQIRLAPNRGEDTAAACGDLLWLGNNTEDFMTQIARRTVLAGAAAGHRESRRRGLRAGQARGSGKRVLGAQGNGEALALPQARCAEGRENAACTVSWCTARRISTRSSYDLSVPGKGEILDDERLRQLRLRRLDHGP
jgi:hypothetical protein